MARFINRRSLRILEYDKILASVAAYTSSLLAKNEVLSLKPSLMLEEVQKDLDLTEQAYKIAFEHCASPSFALDEMEDILLNAQKHALLSCADILKVGRMLSCSRTVFNTINQINDADIADIKSYLSFLFIDNELEKSIYESILGENEVSDNASSTLKSIRQSIKQCNDKIRQKLSSYITASDYGDALQDSIVTMRNNRYVIPVKSEYSGKIKGLVHDRSSSGATIYVEPMAVVELNNEMRSLYAEENNEIERILQYFSQKISYVYEQLQISYKTVANLDCIFAKARYARDTKSVRTGVNDSGVIEIKNGRHPLIDKEKVVPVSISVGDGYNTLLITGPNTGGKTVSLKLVGILCLMICSGLFAPCDADSKIAVFNNIFCDIGDEQDIQQNLSTFSSHMTNLIYICNHVDSNCLLLLDELGGGTDPTEGGALAISLLEYFKNKGCKTITSTHYGELKAYAYASEGILCAGMDFDPVTFKPTYRLLPGQTSSSNALEIATVLGLKEQIVQDARGRLSKEKIAFDNIIKGAEKSRRQALEYERQAKENYEISAKSAEEASKRLNELAEEKQKLDEKMKKSAKLLLSDYLDEAEELIEELKLTIKKGDEAALFEARKLKKRLSDIQIQEESGKKQIIQIDGEISVGDNVYIKELDNVGEVISINEKKKECQVKVGILTTKIKLKDCKRVAIGAEKPQPKVTVAKEFVNKAFSFEINLIGQRVDEALYNLDNYISEAVYNNCAEIRVVHGKGTGILRNAVHEYLKTCAEVENFRLGKYGEGESGVTIVTLK